MAAQQNQPGCDQGKAPLDQKLLLMTSHNRRHRTDNTLPPTVEMLPKESRKVLMDVRYRIFGDVVSLAGSAALAGPPLPLDSKALRSESDIFATRAKGSCGVDPGPVRLRMVILTALPMGD